MSDNYKIDEDGRVSVPCSVCQKPTGMRVLAKEMPLAMRGAYCSFHNYINFLSAVTKQMKKPKMFRR